MVKCERSGLEPTLDHLVLETGWVATPNDFSVFYDCRCGNTANAESLRHAVALLFCESVLDVFFFDETSDLFFG